MKIPSPVTGLLAAVCLVACGQVAFALSDSTMVVASKHVVFPEGPHPAYRQFENLAILNRHQTANDPIVLPQVPIADSILQQRAHAHALLEKVVSGQRFLESLDAMSVVDLPIGVVRAGGAFDYSILVDRITITSAGAVMDVYVSLALPQTGARLAFHGKVPLSAEGGIAGNARVYLLGDHPMKLNHTTMVTIKGTDRSYVEFDCGGFLGVNLDATLEFSSDVLFAETDDGEPTGERLKIQFSTYAQDLHDIISYVTVPPFQVAGLPGFGFRATQAYLDWSDFSNPEAMRFPDGYTSPLLKAGLPDLWQGVYLQQLEIRLPRAFEKQGTAERVSIGVEQMIIDDQGVTGKALVSHVISNGSMNTWTYTVDELSLELVTNQVTALGLKGSLSIPMLSAKDGQASRFQYTAHLSAEGQYIFAVAIEDELKLGMWMADLKLEEGSRIVVAMNENRFYPSAHLSGTLSLNLAAKGPKGSIKGIRFEDMVINSRAPYFEAGTFGFGREGSRSSLAKYPVVIDNIRIKARGSRAGLAFDLVVNISGKAEDESFAGKGALVIWGKQDLPVGMDDETTTVVGEHPPWHFEKVELSSLKIRIDKPKLIELAGEVRFFSDDETYGDGFKGSLTGRIQTIGVEAEALFGRTEAFRYWYADALVELKTGIPIVPGVLSAFGFGGGYYSKMKQGTSSGSVTLGRTPSGITYVPDEETVGIRAVVLIGTPRPEVMSGQVTLEVSINRHGGINAVTFTGNASFMSPVTIAKDKLRALATASVKGDFADQLGSLARGQVYGSVRLHFDNVNDTFHGNLEIYVNVAGGIVRGVSEKNKAGWAVLHFEKHNWYIHIGTPDQPLGLEVARIFKSKSYFMLGKNLPASPPPPPQVSEILGDIDLDYMRDLNALESGMGIAFGLHFLVDTGDLQFLMFYGRFSAGTGLDFMLKDYGNQYHCAGSSGSIGINGWYANGQAYAFVMGKIGIRVKLRFYSGTFDILSIGAAAVLQAKGPNPFWMKGTVGGYYKILGGLVKGKCRFEVTVGKECVPVGEQNLLEDVSMIAGIAPVKGTSNVSVFSAPQVAFNIPVGEVFDITDIEGRRHTFRAVLDGFTVVDNGRRINGTFTWNADRDVVAFDASDILPPNRQLKAKAVLAFEEAVNGVWRRVKFSGQAVVESVETSFETGDAPDYIPASNVLVSYPLRGQENFFPEEYDRGLIHLIDGQPYLFDPDDHWTQKVRMTQTNSEAYFEVEPSYDARQRMITFPVPAALQNGKVYRLEIVNIPRNGTAVDQNVEKITQELAVDASAGNATLTTQSITGTLTALETKSIYSATFRTSKYNTFTEKMQHINLSPAIRYNLGNNVFQLVGSVSGDERFVADELSGPRKVMRMEAVTEGNHWYEGYVYPLLYEGYPLLGWMRVRRSIPDQLGIPPVRDVIFDGLKASAGLQQQVVAAPFSSERLVFNMGRSVAADFRYLQRQAVNYVVDYPTQMTPRLEALIVKPMPFIRFGRYTIRIDYVIPGINKVTSSHEMILFNRIPDNDQ